MIRRRGTRWGKIGVGSGEKYQADKRNLKQREQTRLAGRSGVISQLQVPPSRPERLYTTDTVSWAERADLTIPGSTIQTKEALHDRHDQRGSTRQTRLVGRSGVISQLQVPQPRPKRLYTTDTVSWAERGDLTTPGSTIQTKEALHDRHDQRGSTRQTRLVGRSGVFSQPQVPPSRPERLYTTDTVSWAERGDLTTPGSTIQTREALHDRHDQRGSTRQTRLAGRSGVISQLQVPPSRPERLYTTDTVSWAERGDLTTPGSTIQTREALHDRHDQRGSTRQTRLAGRSGVISQLQVPPSRPERLYTTDTVSWAERGDLTTPGSTIQTREALHDRHDQRGSTRQTRLAGRSGVFSQPQVPPSRPERLYTTDTVSWAERADLTTPGSTIQTREALHDRHDQRGSTRQTRLAGRSGVFSQPQVPPSRPERLYTTDTVSWAERGVLTTPGSTIQTREALHDRHDQRGSTRQTRLAGRSGVFSQLQVPPSRPERLYTTDTVSWAERGDLTTPGSTIQTREALHDRHDQRGSTRQTRLAGRSGVFSQPQVPPSRPERLYTTDTVSWAERADLTTPGSTIQTREALHDRHDQRGSTRQTRLAGRSGVISQLQVPPSRPERLYTTDTVSWAERGVLTTPGSTIQTREALHDRHDQRGSTRQTRLAGRSGVFSQLQVPPSRPERLYTTDTVSWAERGVLTTPGSTIQTREALHDRHDQRGSTRQTRLAGRSGVISQLQVPPSRPERLYTTDTVSWAERGDLTTPGSTIQTREALHDRHDQRGSTRQTRLAGRSGVISQLQVPPSRPERLYTTDTVSWAERADLTTPGSTIQTREALHDRHDQRGSTRQTRLAGRSGLISQLQVPPSRPERLYTTDTVSWAERADLTTPGSTIQTREALHDRHDQRGSTRQTRLAGRSGVFSQPQVPPSRPERLYTTDTVSWAERGVLTTPGSTIQTREALHDRHDQRGSTRQTRLAGRSGVFSQLQVPPSRPERLYTTDTVSWAERGDLTTPGSTIQTREALHDRHDQRGSTRQTRLAGRIGVISQPQVPPSRPERLYTTDTVSWAERGDLTTPGSTIQTREALHDRHDQRGSTRQTRLAGRSGLISQPQVPPSRPERLYTTDTVSWAERADLTTPGSTIQTREALHDRHDQRGSTRQTRLVGRSGVISQPQVPPSRPERLYTTDTVSWAERADLTTPGSTIQTREALHDRHDQRGSTRQTRLVGRSGVISQPQVPPSRPERLYTTDTVSWAERGVLTTPGSTIQTREALHDRHTKTIKQQLVSADTDGRQELTKAER
ncbi:hypothetical protein RRG08_058654 [Elysia crispata]|uniref:Uncharacterized protein n=1 Tax=Elysia crispata TaxID=231223 RepID=A0AAE0Z1R0_9GAST|nr:hypothetical protein RRG08_058654 [Elysia crispata]